MRKTLQVRPEQAALLSELSASVEHAALAYRAAQAQFVLACEAALAGMVDGGTHNVIEVDAVTATVVIELVGVDDAPAA